MARATRKLSESEREQRRRRDRERLKMAAEQLLTSEGWGRWVRVRSRNGLARYSVNNQLLIALARPDATFVAGFRSWLELGYQVRKDEKAVWILAPVKIKERDRVNGEQTGGARVLFRAVPVFDRAQVTAGEHATPLEPPCETLSGDSHEHLLEPLERFAGSLGFTVSFETIDGSCGGWCDHRRRRIVVDAGHAANAQVRILIPWPGFRSSWAFSGLVRGVFPANRWVGGPPDAKSCRHTIRPLELVYVGGCGYGRRCMYLRETKRRNADGSSVSYLALAQNERDPVTGVPRAQIIHRFGRADEVDRDALAVGALDQPVP
jgi:hypothetical protein